MSPLSPFSCVDIITSNPKLIPAPIPTVMTWRSSSSLRAAPRLPLPLLRPLAKDKSCCPSSTAITTPNITSICTRRRSSTGMMISCEVALRSNNSAAIVAEREDETEAENKIGARVRVKVPLKVYHVGRVANELDLNGMEGNIKQYVNLWKGKRISANLPYKVEFSVPTDSQGRGPVKFFAHLKEDEFEYLDS